MSLFTPDTHFVVYMNAKDPKPSQELHSREALAETSNASGWPKGEDPKHHRTTEVGVWLSEWCCVTTNTMLSQVIRDSCASLTVASAGCGEPCRSAVVNVLR